MMKTSTEKNTDRYYACANLGTEDWYVEDRELKSCVATFHCHGEGKRMAQFRAERYADILNFQEHGGECSLPPENANTMVGGGGDYGAVPRGDRDEDLVAEWLKNPGTGTLISCLFHDRRHFGFMVNAAGLIQPAKDWPGSRTEMFVRVGISDIITELARRIDGREW